jgi:hypothetical protein
MSLFALRSFHQALSLMQTSSKDVFLNSSCNKQQKERLIEKETSDSNLPVFESTGGAFEHRLFLHENEQWSSKGPKNIGNTKVTKESEHKHSGKENQLALTSLDRGLKIQWAPLIHQEALSCPPLLAAFLIPFVRLGFFRLFVIFLLHASQFSIFSP